MNYREAFLEAKNRLSQASPRTETPELDARVLLEWAAELNRAGVMARWPDEVEPPVLERLDTVLRRRCLGEPVAWLTGVKEFMGLDFEVGPGLLVPRADTETLVEAALEVGRGPRVLDVCTGTGCVAVSLAHWGPATWRVSAGDLSPLAVQTARSNAQRLLSASRRVTVEGSDLLESLPGPWDLIVSNPPYLTPEETRTRLEQWGWQEPRMALDGGGPEGLDLPQRLIAQAVPALAVQGWLLLEAGGSQMESLARSFESAGLSNVRLWNDLAGIPRVIGGQRLAKLGG